MRNTTATPKVRNGKDLFEPFITFIHTMKVNLTLNEINIMRKKN